MRGTLAPKSTKTSIRGDHCKDTRSIITATSRQRRRTCVGDLRKIAVPIDFNITFDGLFMIIAKNISCMQQLTGLGRQPHQLRMIRNTADSYNYKDDTCLSRKNSDTINLSVECNTVSAHHLAPVVLQGNSRHPSDYLRKIWSRPD